MYIHGQHCQWRVVEDGAHDDDDDDVACIRCPRVDACSCVTQCYHCSEVHPARVTRSLRCGCDDEVSYCRRADGGEVDRSIGA